MDTNLVLEVLEVSDLVKRIQLHGWPDISSQRERQRMCISTQNVNVLLNRPFSSKTWFLEFFHLQPSLTKNHKYLQNLKKKTIQSNFGLFASLVQSRQIIELSHRYLYSSLRQTIDLMYSNHTQIIIMLPFLNLKCLLRTPIII